MAAFGRSGKNDAEDLKSTMPRQNPHHIVINSSTLNGDKLFHPDTLFENSSHFLNLKKVTISCFLVHIPVLADVSGVQTKVREN